MIGKKEIVFVTVTILFHSSYSIARDDNTFFHLGTISDRIVLYFDRMPEVRKIEEREVSKPGGLWIHKTIELFIGYPVGKQIDDKMRLIIETARNKRADDYTLSYAIKHEKKGDLFTITCDYNKERISLQHTCCESISSKKAFIISLYHTDALSFFMRDNSILRNAWQQGSLSDYTIALDCGHGGSDKGKVGVNGVVEKEVNLKIGLRLADQLRKKGFSVVLTRTNDNFVPLDQRTTQSNISMADLFVSIHANAGPLESSGMETYWVSKKKIGQQSMPLVCWDEPKRHFFNALEQKTQMLAYAVHSSLLHELQKKYPIKDRKIKESIAQVLLGTDMPAVLIEVGFLSNPTEAAMLQKPSYQKIIAEGICKGIEKYCNNNKKKYLA